MRHLSPDEWCMLAGLGLFLLAFGMVAGFGIGAAAQRLRSGGLIQAQRDALAMLGETIRGLVRTNQALQLELDRRQRVVQGWIKEVEASGENN